MGRVRIIELKRTLNPREALRERQLDCKNYDKCLTKAANNRWVSFSCRKCYRYKGGEIKLEPVIIHRGGNE